MILSGSIQSCYISLKFSVLHCVIMEPMETDQTVRAFDGTNLTHLGGEIYCGVQWFNNSLSYVIRVSVTIFSFILMFVFKIKLRYV